MSRNRNGDGNPASVPAIAPVPAPAPAPVPVIGFAAFSGTGKTTVLVKLIPLLAQRNCRVGVIKHAHHDFDIDRPGKDSHRIRQAGARQTLIGSRKRRALMVEEEMPEDTDRLESFLSHFDFSRLDLILVEGFKPAVIPKIELHRPSLGHPPLFPDDPQIIAVASDAPLAVPCPLPLLDINRPEELADFVMGFVGETRPR